MILDVIHIPFKLPPLEVVDMTTCLWIPNDVYRSSEDLKCLSRAVSHDQLHRYKIIEQYLPTVFIERIVVSFDELDVQTLRLTASNASVQLFPITTKIHEVDRSGKVRAHGYRHLSGITELIEELTTVPKSRMFSIHQLFLMMIWSAAQTYNRYDVGGVMADYLNAHSERLKSVVTSDEGVVDSILDHVAHMPFEYPTEMFGCNLQEFVATMDSTCQLPTVVSNDLVNARINNRASFASTELIPMLSKGFNQRFGVQLTSHNIFPTSADVGYNIQRELRADIQLLVNALERLPYTDISMTFTDGDCNVNYTLNMFGEAPGIMSLPCREPTTLTSGLVTAMSGSLVHAIGLTLSAFSPFKHLGPGSKCTIVKTFSEDVYLEYTHPLADTVRYYFDLTMFALGTKGIVDIDIVNSVVNPSQEFWKHLNNIFSLNR